MRALCTTCGGRGRSTKRFGSVRGSRVQRSSRSSPTRGSFVRRSAGPARRPDDRGDVMRFGLFYEHQLPRPWDPDSERRLYADALEQIEIADRVGFDFVWEVEHHFMEEYSHSSAPEVFLAAASQRTSRIRLGHGIVQLPHAVNHPARVAERIATLDLVSNGRVEFGTGESSSAAELGGFGVRRGEKRAMWEDAMEAITSTFVEEPVARWESTDL